MITIDKQYTITNIINKSTFICNLFPIKSTEEGISVLNEVRKKYYDATHNCYAYICGDNGEYSRFSDDGEPSQTAGVVILDCLKKNNLTNIIAIVTRYFGGIKLGASGLVRAYSSSTAMAVKEITPLELIRCVTFTITTIYSNHNSIAKVFSKYRELNKEFNDKVLLSYLVPYTDIEPLKKKAIEITKNQLMITISDERICAF